MVCHDHVDKNRNMTKSSSLLKKLDDCFQNETSYKQGKRLQHVSTLHLKLPTFGPLGDLRNLLSAT